MNVIIWTACTASELDAMLDDPTDSLIDAAESPILDVTVDPTPEHLVIKMRDELVAGEVEPDDIGRGTWAVETSQHRPGVRYHSYTLNNKIEIYLIERPFPVAG